MQTNTKRKSKYNLKALFLSFIIIITMFLLQSCVLQKYSLKLNDDDTVQFMINLTLPHKVFEYLDDYNVDTSEIREDPFLLFTEVDDIYLNRDFKKEVKSSDLETKISYYKLYPSVAAFNQEIEKLYESNEIGLSLKLLHKNSLRGQSRSYSGSLEYFLDPEFVKLIKKHPELKKSIPNNSLNAILQIEDNSEILKSKNIKDVENIKTLVVEGNLDNNHKQDFYLETNEHKTFFVLLIFGLIILAVVALLLFLVKINAKIFKKGNRRRKQIKGIDDNKAIEYKKEQDD